MQDSPRWESDSRAAGRTGARVSRRLVLGTGAALAVVAATGAHPVLAATATNTSATNDSATNDSAARPRAQRRAYAFLDAAMDGYAVNGANRLAQSYADQSGLFSTAFVYDNALAVLAYLADDRAESRARATTLGDALLFAQNNDPERTDGRLRQAYSVGPFTFYDGVLQPDGFVRADGKANFGWQFGFLGTAVGDMAWAGLALTALFRCTRARRFLDGAVRIGQWIETNARSETGLGGYSGGVDGGNNPLKFHATEHNIDLVALFGQLADLTRDRVWRERRAHAADFVASMWQPAGGFFATGTDDGVVVNTGIIPEDVQTWSFLASSSRRFARSVDWAADNLKVLDNAGRPNSKLTGDQQFGGVTFSSKSLVANEGAPIAPFQPNPNRNGVWFEGTAHLAAALRQRSARGDESLARVLLGQIELAQDTLGVAQTVGGKALPERSGVVSASSPLDTGFGFGYYPNRHLGATAWYLLAGARANPLRN